jgi:CHAD domain-containing protein/inorganic triphosphatase YgiF
MEIESKFLVAEEVDFQALEKLSGLASYALSETHVQLIEDTFLDTENRAIMAAGYYLRLRKTQGENDTWITIKSLGGFEGGTLRREEYVSFLPEGASVLECSDPLLRNMIFEFTAGFDLFPLLSLKQKRAIRQVKSGEKTIAETYLDRVDLESKIDGKSYKEFEVELKSEGTLEDLKNIRNFLINRYNLAVSPFSKFERAFLFMENLPEKTFLSLKERAFCAQLADQKNLYGKQAKILLALDKSQTCTELSFLQGVPQTEIEALCSKFEKERLSIFPFKSDITKDRKFHLQSIAFSLKTEKKTPEFKEWKPEELLRYYGADKNRAEKTREDALNLFEKLFILHGMGQEEKKLLSLAAFLKDIGDLTFPEEKTYISREILLTHPIKGLRVHEILMLALILKLQDPCINEKNFVSTLKNSETKLPPALQNKALILAVLLRIVTERKSELWKRFFGRELRLMQVFGDEKVRKESEFRIKDEVRKEKKSDKKECKQPGKETIEPADSMGWHGCKILSFQFSCMLSHEKGAIKGENTEEVHDMRVAVRRMRAAARVFEVYLDSEKLEPHLKGLKRTLGVLGTVRDLDVFWEKAEKYLETLPAGHEHDLDPLFTILVEEREKARESMLDYLSSEKYIRFKKELSGALSSPETPILRTTNKKCDALPHRISDVLPAILYARLADVNAYAEWVEGSYLSINRLHRLRIAAKGMRYTLEFFEGILGEEAKKMIKELKSLQDHLGNLHDSIIAIDLLDSFLRTGEWGYVESGKNPRKKSFSEDIQRGRGMEGIEAYLKYRKEEFQTLLDTFPEAWEKIRNGEFRGRIENEVKRLYEVSI